MDPITKALHETWKSIISERVIEPDIKPKPTPRLIDLIKPFPRPGGRIPDIDPGWRPGPRPIFPNPKPKPTPGADYIRPPQPGDAGPMPGIDPGWRPGPRPTIFPNPKPKPTPTPGDGSWGGSKPKPGTGAWGGAQPGKPIYGPDGNLIGVEDNTTPTPKPTPKKDEFIPYINPNPSPFPRPRYIEREPKPIIPTRTPAPQPAAPVTTGSGLLNNIMNINKKAYNLVSGSLPTMPKIYEERDAEGQMAKGELMVLASKAQELANMMKDDTQLEAWVQSKITKAKDYISSVHDYMNGNPDKID
jgi:hypothetical protein